MVPTGILGNLLRMFLVRSLDGRGGQGHVVVSMVEGDGSHRLLGVLIHLVSLLRCCEVRYGDLLVESDLVGGEGLAFILRNGPGSWRVTI